jgi:hypothetical protein
LLDPLSRFLTTKGSAAVSKCNNDFTRFLALSDAFQGDADSLPDADAHGGQSAALACER